MCCGTSFVLSPVRKHKSICEYASHCTYERVYAHTTSYSVLFDEEKIASSLSSEMNEKQQAQSIIDVLESLCSLTHQLVADPLVFLGSKIFFYHTK